MERLHFKTHINASPEKVYQVIIDSDHFREWTSVFTPTSRFEGSWQEGSKMRFLSEDDKGMIQGLISIVKVNNPRTFISLEHTGLIMNGNEVYEGADVEKIKGALENYTLVEHAGGTSLEVVSDALTEFVEYFHKTWPMALERIKSIAEGY